MYVSLFGKNLRKVTAELIASAVIISFIEEFALMRAGFLAIHGLLDFFAITAILAVIELILMFMVEEFLIAAKHVVKKRIKRRRS
ncbi:MAG: hypothetical protein M1348_03755 [Candidatus Parvarchaeota archaeon]|jgi:hypothetical protein|nr:hypothetical protein [Candidatus Parvarchaeota archaeon]MCL5101694.1 hypothetical protein [Candidatus Parvarchaeota archaeon]